MKQIIKDQIIKSGGKKYKVLNVSGLDHNEIKQITVETTYKGKFLGIEYKFQHPLSDKLFHTYIGVRGSHLRLLRRATIK